VQNGDSVVGYRVPYATNCDNVKRTNIKCVDWDFPSMWDYVYPYCYNVTKATRYKWTL
jgi:hypothetical protein